MSAIVAALARGARGKDWTFQFAAAWFRRRDNLLIVARKRIFRRNRPVVPAQLLPELFSFLDIESWEGFHCFHVHTPAVVGDQHPKRDRSIPAALSAFRSTDSADAGVFVRYRFVEI